MHRLNRLAEILRGAERCFLLALISIASPVAGLRPMRAERLRTSRVPSPAMRIRAPFLRCSPIKATVPASISFACFVEIPCASPIEVASWRSVTSSPFTGFTAALTAAAALTGTAFLATAAGLREATVLAIPIEFVFAIDLFFHPLALRRRAGRRGRSRTRWVWCANASSRQECGSRASTS